MLQNFYEPGERASSEPSIFIFSSASGEGVCDLWLINERAKSLARSAHCQPCFQSRFNSWNLACHCITVLSARLVSCSAFLATSEDLTLRRGVLSGCSHAAPTLLVEPHACVSQLIHILDISH